MLVQLNNLDAVQRIRADLSQVFYVISKEFSLSYPNIGNRFDIFEK